MGIGGGSRVSTHTRRTLAKQLGMLFAAAAVSIRAGAPLFDGPREPTVTAQDTPPQPTPVVSFFLDQPYLDATGLDEPYRPPQGMRAGQAVASLSEQEFRNLMPHA
jgi:hypothetical protein